MRSETYHERLWESVPEGIQPPDFALRLAFLLRHVAADQRVLDVGCGEGRFTAALADSGAQAVGVDVAEEPLRRARARRGDLQFLRVPVDHSWPLEDASFDAVWAGEVIEHVADTVGWLSELRRVLRPGGLALLSTPNHSRASLLAMALLPHFFEAHFDPLSDHLRFYTRRSLARVLEEFRFEAIRVSPAGGLPGAHPLLLASARRARW